MLKMNVLALAIFTSVILQSNTTLPRKLDFVLAQEKSAAQTTDSKPLVELRAALKKYGGKKASQDGSDVDFSYAIERHEPAGSAVLFDVILIQTVTGADSKGTQDAIEFSYKLEVRFPVDLSSIDIISYSPLDPLARTSKPIGIVIHLKKSILATSKILDSSIKTRSAYVKKAFYSDLPNRAHDFDGKEWDTVSILFDNIDREKATLDALKLFLTSAVPEQKIEYLEL